MLNLRQINQTDGLTSISNARRPPQSTIQFRVPSYLGNIGEPLDHGGATRFALLDDRHFSGETMNETFETMS